MSGAQQQQQQQQQYECTIKKGTDFSQYSYAATASGKRITNARARACQGKGTAAAHRVTSVESSAPPNAVKALGTTLPHSVVHPTTIFQLASKDSYITEQKKVVESQWCSSLLQCETEMREFVVTGGVNEPPSLERIVRVMQLYDAVVTVSQDQSALLADLLRLFRIEFSRSIFIDEENRYAFSRVADSNGLLASVAKEAVEGPSCLPETFFEKTESLLRDTVALKEELKRGVSIETVASLERQLEEAREQVSWYESEVDRLRRQYDQAADDCMLMRRENERLVAEHASSLRKLEHDVQTLNVENKDMLLQLFRLRKQIAGGKSNILKDAYRQLKNSKMSMMQTLFNEGDERLGLLVLLSQIENRLNEVLDSYDNDFVLTMESGHRELQLQMAQTVSILLEEMHFCEASYRRLVEGDTCKVSHKEAVATAEIFGTMGDEEPNETDGYVAILFDHKIYERLLARQALRTRLAESAEAAKQEEQRQRLAVEESERIKDSFSFGTSSAVQSNLSFRKRWSLESDKDRPMPVHGKALSPTPDITPDVEERMSVSLSTSKEAVKNVINMNKQKWVDHILNPAAGSSTLLTTRSPETGGHVVLLNRQYSQVISDENLMKRLLHLPLEDLSSRRFLSTVEVFAGEDPLQQKMLCRVNHVDPSAPIQVPEATNFIKVKYAFSENAVLSHEIGVIEGINTAHATGTEEVNSVTRPPTASNSDRLRRDRTFTKRRGKRNGDGGENAVTIITPATAAPSPAVASTTSMKSSSVVFRENEDLKLFHELGSRTLVAGNPGLQYCAGAISSTTASAVAFKRLQPMSPNRAPEWLLYQSLFGRYRTLAPRMMEVTTIDHIISRSCERYFTRMEYRYEECFQKEGPQCPNMQLRLDMTERLFRDLYELSDFQEALLDELEARYGYPELVAKTLYEMLCYLDAVAEKDALLAQYLDVIRGFVSPTQIHFISYMLFHLSYCWPVSDPTAPVNRDDALTVLEYVYRNAKSVTRIDAEDILRDYDMATLSTPISLMSLRNFYATSMKNLEEPLLLFLNQVLNQQSHTQSGDISGFDTYDMTIRQSWRQKDERRSLVRYLATTLGVNRSVVPSLSELTYMACSCWCSNLWE